jgi:hypothetical protein
MTREMNFAADSSTARWRRLEIRPRPSMGRLLPLSILMCLTVMTASVGLGASAAHADVDSGFVGSEVVAEALENVQGDFVRVPRVGLPTALSSDAEGTATDAAMVSVVVPDEATDGITLSAGDFTMNIGLPNADEAGPSVPSAQGSMVYPSAHSSASAVIPTGDGVQLLSVIDSEKAAESFEYDLGLLSGHLLGATADGGARVVDQEGVVKAEFEPAWAQDAAGIDVPTRYSVEGNTLTQIVDHRDLEGVAYPVVADPLPVVVIVITAAAMIVVAAAALGVAVWLVVSWWNTCRAQNKYPQLSTINGFTARCVR